MVRASRGAPWFVRILVGCCGLLLWSTVALAQKTDIITLDNGDRITCEIQELERGRLRCKTDAMGTVYIEWDRVAAIDTDKTLEIELDNGRRYFGSIKPGETAAEMKVTVGQASTPISNNSVAFFKRINPTFWGKLEGGIDFGVSFNRADNQLDFSLSASSTHTGRSDIFNVELSSLIKKRDGASTTNRQVFGGQWIRQLRWQRWPAWGLFLWSATTSLISTFEPQADTVSAGISRRRTVGHGWRTRPACTAARNSSGRETTTTTSKPV